MMHFADQSDCDECPDTGDIETLQDGKIDFGIISTPVTTNTILK